MHRAGVYRAFRRGYWSGILFRSGCVRLRAGPELAHALRAAEVIGRPFVRDFLLWISRHLHTANGVGEWFLRIRRRVMMFV